MGIRDLLHIPRILWGQRTQHSQALRAHWDCILTPRGSRVAVALPAFEGCPRPGAAWHHPGLAGAAEGGVVLGPS